VATPAAGESSKSKIPYGGWLGGGWCCRFASVCVLGCHVGLFRLFSLVLILVLVFRFGFLVLLVLGCLWFLESRSRNVDPQLSP